MEPPKTKPVAPPPQSGQRLAAARPAAPPAQAAQPGQQPAAARPAAPPAQAAQPGQQPAAARPAAPPTQAAQPGQQPAAARPAAPPTQAAQPGQQPAAARPAAPPAQAAQPGQQPAAARPAAPPTQAAQPGQQPAAARPAAPPTQAAQPGQQPAAARPAAPPAQAAQPGQQPAAARPAAPPTQAAQPSQQPAAARPAPATTPTSPEPTATRTPAPAKGLPPRRPRRRPVAAEDDLDAWLMSFADLITLMLALFVVLYAASRIDANKAEQIQESLTKTLAGNIVVTQETTRSVGYSDLMREIRTGLDALGLEGVAHVQLVSSGVELTTEGDILFASGSADILPSASPLLNRIADLVVRLPYAIRIEGHTDDIPIHSQQFPSNWELSAARASCMARFLIDRGIAPSRLAVTGYADTRPLPPVATATDVERRAANRRVVFLFEK